MDDITLEEWFHEVPALQEMYEDREDRLNAIDCALQVAAMMGDEHYLDLACGRPCCAEMPGDFPA